MKAIILARVSTDEQMRLGKSIPAQLSIAREYCKAKNLEIFKEFQFDESSTKDYREKFELVLEEIKISKEKIALIIETVDRLQRSFNESVILEELRKKDKVEIHFLRENLVISINSNSSDLIRWDMAVLVARSYVLQLSDNVKRSIYQNIREGRWPGKAPYGYINTKDENEKSNILPDPFKSQVVKKIFELYSSKAYSIRQIKEKIKKDYNENLTLSYIPVILKNPFYCGYMVFKEKIYPHRYEKIIDKSLFNSVQELINQRKNKRFKYYGLPYLYRGLIRCSKCGCMYTPEKQKGIVYYHCTGYKGKHNDPWLREDEITKQIAEVYKKIKIPKEVLEDIVESLKNIHEGKAKFSQELYKKLTEEKEKYLKRLDSLYIDKLDGRITNSIYDKFYIEFRSKIDEIDEKLANFQKAEDNYFITVNYLLELANRSYELFLSSKLEEKRLLIKLTLSNLEAEGKTLRYNLLKPFNYLFEYSNCLPGLRG